MALTVHMGPLKWGLLKAESRAGLVDNSEAVG